MGVVSNPADAVKATQNRWLRTNLRRETAIVIHLSTLGLGRFDQVYLRGNGGVADCGLSLGSRSARLTLLVMPWCRRPGARLVEPVAFTIPFAQKGAA